MSSNYKDISKQVTAALPEALKAKLEEAEKVLGKSVVFYEVAALYGAAQGALDPSGKIYVASSSADDMGVVGEELMHLHWRTSGFPRMNPLKVAESGAYASAIHQIGGHFEEYTFFPFLESLKLNPRAAVDKAMPDTEKGLTNLIPQIAGDTDYWRVLLTALYTQAKIMANAEAGSRVLKVFERKVLQSFAAIGQAVCDEIVAAKDQGKDAVKEHMERTLFTHLNLKTDTSEVKPIY